MLSPKPRDFQILQFRPAGGGTQPSGQTLLHRLAPGMADDHFSRFAHPRTDVAELAAPVCRLVQIHEIHIDRRPRNISIELRVQMGQRFSQTTQTRDPHLGGRKGVHPADEPEAVRVGIGLLGTPAARTRPT